MKIPAVPITVQVRLSSACSSIHPFVWPILSSNHVYRKHKHTELFSIGLSLEVIVVACVVPFVVALFLMMLLVIWQKARARRLHRAGSNEFIADEDKRRHTDSTNGSRNDSGQITYTHRRLFIPEDDVRLQLSIGIEIVVEEPNTLTRDTVEPQLRNQVHNKPVDAKYLEPDMLYESQRGRTAWVLPPLLGIEQEFPRDHLCSIKVLGVGKFSKVPQRLNTGIFTGV